MTKYDFNNPKDLQRFREKIEQILEPIHKMDSSQEFTVSLQMRSSRTKSGYSLPHYYLVYFLFIDLLQFENRGRFDKVAWSIPITYRGIPFTIEHRKLGLGVFGDLNYEHVATEIVNRINRAVVKAEPYFEFLAASAAKQSRLNVTNKSQVLFARYSYFLQEYKAIIQKAQENKGVKIVKQIGNYNSRKSVSIELYQIAGWTAISVIEAFFSWTEHVFIHIAILKGKIKTGEEVADLAQQDWSSKFKSAIPLTKKEMKSLYNELLNIRRQVRNYITHGSFGKNGEAFQFHSGAGAVPLQLPHQSGKARFTFNAELGFNDQSAIDIVEKFMQAIWNDDRKPARIYIQEHGLPLILTLVTNGEYDRAMQSVKAMEEFSQYWLYVFDRSLDMDF